MNDDEEGRINNNCKQLRNIDGQASPILEVNKESGKERSHRGSFFSLVCFLVSCLSYGFLLV